MYLYTTKVKEDHNKFTAVVHFLFFAQCKRPKVIHTGLRKHQHTATTKQFQISTMTDQMTLADNGVITVPGTGKRGPPSQGGGSKLKPCDLGGRHIVFKPGREGTVLWWHLPKSHFEYPKRYVVSCRYKTDHEQEPLKFEIKQGDEVLFETTLPIKDSGNEWTESDPIDVTCEVGSPSKDMELHIMAPTIQGRVFYLKDWKFTPPGTSETKTCL